METALIPIQEVKMMADAVAKSGLFKAFGTADRAFTMMMLAQAEGCHPMQALQRYDIIEGEKGPPKPAKKSDAMLADFQQRGGKVGWDVMSETEVRATFEAPGLTKPLTVSWTIAMATKANLVNKYNWKNYPRAMLRARVISEGIRASMPGVVAGLYTPEEVQDFSPIPAGHTQQSAGVAATPVVDAEIVQPKASAEQIKALCAAMNGIGIKDREDVLAWCTERVGHPITSRKDLTVVECSACIEATKAQIAAPAESEPGSNDGQ